MGKWGPQGGGRGQGAAEGTAGLSVPAIPATPRALGEGCPNPLERGWDGRGMWSGPGGKTTDFTAQNYFPTVPVVALSP